MTRRALFVPAFVLPCAALALEVACEDDPPFVARSHEGTSGGSSGSTSGGSVPLPPDPNFDPNTLLDSGPVPSLNDGAACEGIPIGNGTIDQENLTQSGAFFLTPTTGEPYQTFTVATSGYLAGIELAVQRADVGTGDTIGKMRVELRSFPANELLASSELPLMNFPLAKPPREDRRITLASGPPGKGYFPFGAGCARLTAGGQYYFQTMLVDVPDGVCSDPGTDAGTCTVGRVGDWCSLHAQHCDPKIWVSSTTTGNPYDGGGWNNGARGDMVFRTYMQP